MISRKCKEAVRECNKKLAECLEIIGEARFLGERIPISDEDNLNRLHNDICRIIDQYE